MLPARAVLARRVWCVKNPIFEEMCSMAETMVLEVSRRNVQGKHVRHLRAEGIVPGVIYGPTFESLPVQVEWIKLRPVLRAAGGSHLIQLTVEGETHNTLVREVQRDPIRGEVLHIDFYRVRMDVVLRTDVPISLAGSDALITKNGGVVTHEMTSIQVECLPGNLPAEIEIDLSLLKEVGDSLLVKDLPELPGVTYLVGADNVVVSSSMLLQGGDEEEEEEEEVVSEGAEPELVRRREEEEEEE
jgi:large subunit ribosomal protein L25